MQEKLENTFILPKCFKLLPFNYNFTQFDIEEVSFFSVLTRDLVVSAACSPSFVDVRKHVASRLVCNVLLVLLVVVVVG